jgi:AcrR family transcriptional regulator
MTTRAYDSPLRAEQAERTREKILEALAAELAEGGEEFSIPRVAKRAGVSTRTVYHHFPNRDAQVDALAHWIEKRTETSRSDALPATLEELAPYTQARCEMFFENEQLMRAQLAPGIAERVRARRRRVRDKAIDEVIASARLPADDTRLASALMKHLISAKFGLPLVDVHGLPPSEATRVQCWAVELVVRSLLAGEGPLTRRAKR